MDILEQETSSKGTSPTLNTSVCISELSCGCAAITKDCKVSVTQNLVYFLLVVLYLSAAVAVSSVQDEKAALIVHTLFSHWGTKKWENHTTAVKLSTLRW